MAEKKLDLSRLDGAIFDMDGVITRTAETHAAAWKQLFDEFLVGTALGTPLFDIDRDYRLYVDGKPRYDGVASFLASRNISLPWGHPSDPPGEETICALGNRKDAYFQEIVGREGVRPYDSTVALLKRLRASNRKTGVFTSSRSAVKILAAAGVTDLFDARIDGVSAEQAGLPGKPDPAVLLELTRRLGLEPARTAVFEDAIAGVQAGHSGRFGVVVGVNRGAHDGDLLRNGATIEVRDLSELVLVD
jgi:alpha,alpha-trehalase